MPDSPFNGYAESYDTWYDKPPGREAFAVELAALRRVVAELPHPWLEVGVGTGRFAQALGIPLGVDPSAAMLRLAQARGIRTVQAVAESLPFPDGEFGTVFLLTTWEFLSEPGRALLEIRRVLKPGGMLVNAYLDKGGKWAKLYLRKAEAGHPLFSRARFYDYEEVVRLTRESGFDILRTVSALFSGPDEDTTGDEPRDGFHPGASFVVIVSRNGQKTV